MNVKNQTGDLMQSSTGGRCNHTTNPVPGKHGQIDAKWIKCWQVHNRQHFRMFMDGPKLPGPGLDEYLRLVRFGCFHIPYVLAGLL